MDKKKVFAIISVLVVASIAMLAYVGTTHHKLYSNLERYNIVKGEIKEKIIQEDELFEVKELPEIRDIEVNDYIEPLSYSTYDAPDTTGFKSYMDYRTITDETTRQHRLQDRYAKTNEYGIRMVDGRYCVAVGSRFTSDIGQYFDLILENGTVIPCVLADQKADEHTDSDNIVTMHNGCMSEFVVDTDSLEDNVKIFGDMSMCRNDWGGRVVQVKVYDKNVFDEE